MSLWPLGLLAACSSHNYAVMMVGEPISRASMLVRLHDVAFPLLVAAAESCPFEQEPTYGFFLKDQETPKAVGERRELGASVTYVHSRLPAASAGLALGDRVMLVNEKSVIEQQAEQVVQLVRKMTLARIQPLKLDVIRAGDPHTFYMWAIPACQFTVQLIESNEINGITDGRRVGVTTGVMRFIRSDSELAWVLAHEIAHNVLSHVQNARLRAMLNGFLAARVGAAATAPAPAPRRSLEAQADYVGSYIMARAGYDLRAIRQVWQRMETGWSQQVSPRREMVVTHPTTTERLAAFEETLKEIEEKRDRGELLQPVLENTQ